MLVGRYCLLLPLDSLLNRLRLDLWLTGSQCKSGIGRCIAIAASHGARLGASASMFASPRIQTLTMSNC